MQQSNEKHVYASAHTTYERIIVSVYNCSICSHRYIAVGFMFQRHFQWAMSTHQVVRGINSDEPILERKKNQTIMMAVDILLKLIHRTV